MSIQKLDPQALAAALQDLPDWRIENEKLHREFRFADFKTAFAFMTRCAEKAEELNHHPEWFNVYNKVIVDLTTHDAGGISQSDFDLARSMNAFAAELK
ncbi:MAG: 4a-hydroxytetrahydrobiopterin dehydratase [bacterium]|nr:4a-hydroxytetrahydrobiopterin dehydratase [bacterium]